MASQTRPDKEETCEDSLRAAGSPAVRREPYLFLLLHCDHPSRASWRYGLAGIDKVRLGRGETTEAHIERAGQSRNINVAIADRHVSSRHAQLERAGQSFVVFDAGSRNGTWVNGKPAEGRTVLADGDFIGIGHTLLRFRSSLRTTEQTETLQSLAAGSVEPGLSTLLPGLAQAFRDLGRIAAGEGAVLIRGETGSGKDLIAQAIHRRSPRRDRPLVAVNCAAFQESLLQSELFGHEKGAFTGAMTDKLGLVRSAASGTLFLDEVGDLPPPAQAALLRTLQTKTVRPLGSTRDFPVDFRLLSATHRDLQDMIAKERFRSDLYARLNAFEMVMPPLRKRREDLGIIISHILQKQGRANVLTKEAASILFQDDWPLNIRELEQCLVSACALAGQGPIEPMHLGKRAPSDEESTAPSAPPAEAAVASSQPLGEQALYAQLIAQLKEAEGNVAAVGRSLGKKPPQIFRWLKRFGIDPDEFRPKLRRGP